MKILKVNNQKNQKKLGKCLNVLKQKNFKKVVWKKFKKNQSQNTTKDNEIFFNLVSKSFQ